MAGCLLHSDPIISATNVRLYLSKQGARGMGKGWDCGMSSETIRKTIRLIFGGHDRDRI